MKKMQGRRMLGALKTNTNKSIHIHSPTKKPEQLGCRELVE